MDPELAAVVAALPPMAAGDPVAARLRMKEFLAHLAADAKAAGSDGLTISDRTIPGPPGAPAIRVRLYEPNHRRVNAPCLVYFHGGGFIAGDLDSEHVRCVRLSAQADCVVVSVDYRLAPEHRFPAAVEDCYAALVWAAASADDLGIDLSRVGIGGVSAGGALAAAVALMARDRGGPVVAFQMLMFPVLDDRMETASMTLVGTPLFDGPGAARMWSSYLDGNRSTISPYAAPARAEDLHGLPPTYLVTGEFDPLRDEGIAYALRLLAADVSVELHNFAGGFHAFDAFPSAVSTRAANEQVEWLRRIADRLKDSVPEESLRQSTDGAST
jgi:acetyl esterase